MATRTAAGSLEGRRGRQRAFYATPVLTAQSDPSHPVPAVELEAEDDVQAASLVSNSTFTLAARVYGVLASAVIAIFTVRLLPVGEYGRYALAMAIVLIIGSLAEMGTSTLVTRRVAAEPSTTSVVLGIALAATLCVAVPAALLVVPLGLILGYSGQVIVLLAVGSGVILTQGVLAVLNGAFQGRRIFSLFAATSVVQASVLMFGGVGVLLAGAGAEGLVAVAVLSYAAASAGALVLLSRRFGVRPRMAGALAEAPAFVRAVFPIAATAAAAVVYGRVDVLLLGGLDSDRAVAIYNLPLTIVEITFLIPAAIAVPFFPLLTRQLEEDLDDARDSFDLLLRLFLLGSVPIALVLGVAGGDLLALVFGDAYRASGDVLAWLSATVVLNFLIYLLWYGLLAAHLERGRLPALLVGLAVNVGANLVLIPAHGAQGAAAALVLTDALMAVWLAVLVQRGVVDAPFARRTMRPLMALALAVTLLALTPGWDDTVRAALAAAAYVGVLLATRYVRPAEWAPLTAPLAGLVRSRRRAKMDK